MRRRGERVKHDGHTNSPPQCGYLACSRDGITLVSMDGHLVALCRTHLGADFWPMDLQARIAKARDEILTTLHQAIPLVKED